MKLGCLLALLLVSTAARANDEGALALADRPPAEPEKASDWRSVVEASLGHAQQRSGRPGLDSRRLSLDTRWDSRIAPGWRAVFANRLDWRWQNQAPADSPVNTLKEAYLSHAFSSTESLDAGRINLRSGVASGYNPTDFLRVGALRSVVSPNPSSLRNNRLGSFMLRGQTLWNEGAASLAFAPKLRAARSDDPLSLDAGASNPQHRLLLTATQRLAEGFSPQGLLYWQDGQAVQLGVNLTALLGPATVAHFEWAGGREASLKASALQTAADVAFRQRWTSGLSYSGLGKATLTLEYQFNGTGLTRGEWDQLRAGPPAAYGAVRQLALLRQDPPTRGAWFAALSWPDAGISQLDLAAFLRHVVADGSRQAWFEARYHWGSVDLAVQWQGNSGRPGSEYGAAIRRQSWQLLFSGYF